MNLRFTLSVLLLAFIALPGCGGKDGDHKDHDHKDHDHKDESHKDHDHKDEGHKDHKHGENEAGPRKVLGKSDLLGYSVEVALYGEAKAGSEAALDVVLTGGTGEPQAVRAWIGVESGDGSIKAKLEKEGKGFHGHVETPKTLAAGSAVWVEIQDDKGEKKAAKFSW